MKVLVIGSGAREHALAWKLSQSPLVGEVLAAPGNAGTAEVARNVPVVEHEVASIVGLARREKADLVVIGPEVPIANGVADALENAGIRVFAPLKRAALMESSKVWAKAFLSRNGIPTAPFYVSSRIDDATALVRLMPTPVVIKASGLAAGKGVSVVGSIREAEEVLRRMMVERAMNGAGDEVVLEGFLEGREVSLLAFVDGDNAIPMPFACDYKRLEEGDHGPNTGGMGAYSPAPWITPEIERSIMDRIFHPTLEALRTEQIDYRGILYFGIMVTAEGPWVLEFNVRFGDPETQVLLPRLQSDLCELMLATAERRLSEVRPMWSNDAACGVVIASRGYPNAYETGMALPLPETRPGVHVFHAGTAMGPDGVVVARGGRLATVVGTGPDVAAAREKAYGALAGCGLGAFHFRRDVGATAAVLTS